MTRPGSIENQATSEDDSAAATAWLPRDVLAGILLRLPASNLRRYRHVCKEWREIISDFAFVDEHMDHGSQTPTHTIVFFSGNSQVYRDRYFFNNFWGGGTKLSRHGEGYLLDEHWRVAARFTVSESEDMVGTCKGLLCFLNVLDEIISIVEPFTGESITLPLPPETKTWHDHCTYCFGFDCSSRRYKLLHLSKASEQGLYMYTIGEDTSWRSVHVAGAAPGVSYTSPRIIDGEVHWCMIRKEWVKKLMRFDLATEETTASELIKFRLRGYPDVFIPVLEVLGVLDARVCLMTTGQQNVLFIEEGAHWANSSTLRLPPSRRLTWPQALQRGHLLLADHMNGGLYAHPVAPSSYDLGLGNLVLETAVGYRHPCEGGTNSTPRCNTRGLFVPVPEGGRRFPQTESDARTYCYAPPLAPAPLERHFGKL